MSIPFNTFLTNEYVKKYENPQALEYTKILCNDLKYVFRRILLRNKWLQPSTKNTHFINWITLNLFLENLKI